MKEICGIWLPDHEEHLLPHILKGPLVDGKGTYQLPKIQLALSHTKGRRFAVDVGAHVGLISRILAMDFEHVEAFEPLPDHQQCFTQNVWAENVTLHGCALGSAPGEVMICRFPGNSGHSHVADHGDIAVPLQTLDSFELEAVDFVKIDTEGYERDVLLGAIETLKRCRPTLMVEQKPNNGRRYGGDDYAALKLLERLGARRVAQKAGDYILVWP
jgi:FkbM family methyltransferase